MKDARWGALPLSIALAVGALAPTAATAAEGDDSSVGTKATAASADPTDPTDPQGKNPKSPDKKRFNDIPVSVSVNTGSAYKVGVGQLVTMTFSQPVARRKAVEQAIKVKANRDLPPGAWGWFGDQTAIYRPKRFWPGKARIRFNLNLDGVILARQGKTRYVGNQESGRTAVLRTGRSFVMQIKDSRHRMYVKINGSVKKVFPVALVKPGYQTRSGIKILTGEKYVKLRMTGTDRFSGETWDVISPYSIRLTPTGEFIHGAPWAYQRLGKYNGSHGCTNMFINDARWLYNRVLPGDPVVTKGTGRPMEVTNGTPGSYWNYSYAAWKAKSASK